MRRLGSELTDVTNASPEVGQRYREDIVSVFDSLVKEDDFKSACIDAIQCLCIFAAGTSFLAIVLIRKNEKEKIEG